MALAMDGERLVHGVLVRRGRRTCQAATARAQDASITPPLAYGAHRSKLLEALRRKPHAGKVQLDEEERLRLVLWIDANAPYHDAFVDKRPELPAYDLALDRELHRGLLSVHERRCASCHEAAQVTRLDWIDLESPGKSLFLSAPLAVSAGGAGKCGPSIYAGVDDPDYALARDLVERAVQKAWASPRRDLTALGFRR